MSDVVAQVEKDTIHVEYELAEGPEKVWRALTEPELLAKWLMPNDIRGEVGHRFTFRSEPRPGWDGVVHCEVLEVAPERKLVYAWRGGSGGSGGRPELDTVVTWTLEGRPEGGTRLRLAHSGFDRESFAFKALGQGWRGKVAERMAHVLSTTM